MMVVVDVPIDSGKHLGVILVGGKIRPRTGVVAVFILNEIGNFLEVVKSRTRDVIVGISD